LYASFVITQQISLIIAIVVGIGILIKKQGWAWFMAISLHALITVIFGMAVALLAPYASNSRIAILVVSLVSLYLLVRKDVRNYLRPARIT
jgi:hypothetical protein